jgi:hypothetical protein
MHECGDAPAVTTAFADGLLGDFSDLLFGFLGTEVLIMIPLLIVLAKLLTRLSVSIRPIWAFNFRFEVPQEICRV